MLVTLVRLTLHAPHSHSLKERRAVVRHVVDRVMARHKVVVADVGGQDTWQRIELGFAVVGSDGVLCNRIADKVIAAIEDASGLRRLDLQREQQPFGHEPQLADGLEDWVPDFAKDDPT